IQPTLRTTENNFLQRTAELPLQQPAHLIKSLRKNREPLIQTRPHPHQLTALTTEQPHHLPNARNSRTHQRRMRLPCSQRPPPAAPPHATPPPPTPPGPHPTPSPHAASAHPHANSPAPHPDASPSPS